VTDVGQQITKRNLSIQPTLTVRAGFQVNLIVNKGMVLRPSVCINKRESPTNRLRLGPLPKTELIKVTIALSVRLKFDLDHYATLHSEEHKEVVDTAAIIPHRLEAFVAKDRSSQRMRKRGGRFVAT
jgi:hypothetical protein